MNDDTADGTPPLVDRRRPPVETLHQPEGPAIITATVGTKVLIESGEVVELTDRTVVVETDDPAVALALNLAPEVSVSVQLAGDTRELRARPGRRATDNPSSRRVELVVDDLLA